MVLIGCAHDPEGTVEHLRIALAIEDGLALHELAEQAADGPHVDAKKVVFASEDDLWGHGQGRRGARRGGQDPS